MPRLGRTADFGADLNAVLSQSPVSVRWLARTLQFAQTSPLSYSGEKFRTGLNWLLDFKLSGELRPLGLNFPFMVWCLFEDKSFRMNIPLVAPPEASKSAALPVNYIDAIAAAEVDALKAHTVAGSAPSSLLYLALRHSTLQVMARAAFRATGSPIAEHVFHYNPDDTVWTRLHAPIASLGDRSLADVFKGPLPDHPDLAEMALHRTALSAISRVPVGELERLTAEVLDASSYRLDAWITSLASERLASMRAAKPLGSHLGAYAWVDAPPVPAVLPRDGAAPEIDPDSEGYMHAPGLEHARTAAILRAGFIARRQEGSQADLALDLSSERVRDARSLLGGIRNGASLAALLGERIERWMVEAGAGPDLAGVRDQFPLTDGGGRKRIDGLKAAQAWSNMPQSLLTPVQLRIVAVMDSIGDLLLAEAVHQQAKGNPSRAQPALAALETGVGLPGEFDVVRTDSNAKACTWRLVLPLAPAELNAWIGGIIGNPAALSATVTRPGQQPVIVTLKDIDVSAAGLLDFVKAGAEATALSDKLSDKAGGGAVTYSPALETALQAAFAISRLLRNSRKLQDGDVGQDRTPVPSFERRSVRKQWLHDLARVRPSVEALDSLDFVLRRAGKEVPLQFVAADQDLNIAFIGAPPDGALSGLLIDGWNETTPGTEVTTGIAMHYDAPRSRAPQAILVMTPPDRAGWSIDAVEGVLTETAQLAQVRMVRPADVQGSFLPAIYFANNYANDAVATNFSSLGIIPNFVSP